MKIKYIGKSGSREVRVCKYCTEEFETLSVKVRQGGEIFCSSICYHKSREKTKEQNKEMHIKHQRMYKYGLSEDDFNSLVLNSNNSCMICRKEFTKESRYTVACVDHCHTTEKIRGLLCHKCNKGLGAFSDRVDLLENAIRYLKISKENK